MIVESLKMFVIYLHDLFTAFFFSNSLFMWLFKKRGILTSEIFRLMRFYNYIFLVLLLAGGGLRAIFYRELEWNSQAGSAQIYMLIFKHVILAGLVLTGIIFQETLNRRFKGE